MPQGSAPRRGPVGAAARGVPGTAPSARGARVRAVAELLARPRVVLERAAPRARDRLGVLLLDPPHHHAEVECLDDDTDTGWLENFIDRRRDLLGEAFLHLKAAREDVDDARNLRQPDDVLLGDVRNV